MPTSFSFPPIGLSSLTAYFLFLGGILTSLYLFYRWALPKPIPGIPYNKEAVESLFGDIGPLMKYQAKTKEVFGWIAAQNIKLQSPIIQVFLRPFGKPWVVITDFREAQDIMLRRTQEFDRSNYFGDIFLGLLPKGFVGMKSTNPEFKQHRRWLQDLMTPGFLHQVAAPHIYTACDDLVQLWAEKLRLVDGRPFAAPEDIIRAALDAVWAIDFGADPSSSATKTQLRMLSQLQTLSLPDDVDKAVPIPETPYPPVLHSFIVLTDSLETSVQSSSPVVAHWFLRKLPYMRRAIRAKENFIREQIEKTKDRFQGKEQDYRDVRCATDEILRREILLAEKEERAPVFHSRGIYDEVGNSQRCSL
jgi:hypothetical protein